MSKHSSLVGGSTAQRMINCPAHWLLTADMVKIEQPPSIYAQEGIALHSVMEGLLLGTLQCTADNLIGMVVEGITITPDLFHEKVVPAWEATLEAFTRLGIEEYEPEIRVEFTSIYGAHGTADIIGKSTVGNNPPVILDYKFGSGYMVSPHNNDQLKFYAAAASETEAVKDWFDGLGRDDVVVMGIIQPDNDPVLQTAEITMRELGVYTASLMISTDRAKKDPDLEPNPGDWCKYCPAIPVCPAMLALARKAEKLSQDTVKDLAEAITLATALEPWISAVKTQTHLAMEQGNKVEGWKLVAKRATRRWVDEDNAHAKLKRLRSLSKADYEKVTLLSPPQIEKQCKQKGVDFTIFESYIEAVSSGTTLAHESDKRAEVIISEGREIPDHLLKRMK